MSKVGILYICTGEYAVFWPEFYASMEQFFLKNSEVHYFVFTDAEIIEHQNENDRIHLIQQEACGWPYSTLLRFSIFLGAQEQLRTCDYVFFFNANAQVKKPILESDFLPREEKGERLLFVQHPGFYNKRKYEYTYDRNPRCSAYIPYWKGTIYICGGINGGKTEAFLEMCEVLNNRICADLQKEIIPEWHDESQINRYILDRNDYRLLSPAYCCPEKWNIPFECIVLIRDKKRYIDIEKIRKNAPESRISTIYRMFNVVAKFYAVILATLKKEGEKNEPQ